jgi:ribulose-5-phosphate 4-epimerase/fuculose-1-phosphate aldolase
MSTEAIPAESSLSYDLRRNLTIYSHRLYERHMVSASGGNISCRFREHLLISPTGEALGDLRPEDFVLVDIATGEVTGNGKPSKELPLHAAVYRRRADTQVVIHGHSAYALAASTLLEPNPEDSLPTYSAGYRARVGKLPLLPYFDSGSKELSDGVAEGIGDDRKAVLLQNHGFVAAGPTFAAAFNTSEEIHEAALVYVMTTGKARSL